MKKMQTGGAKKTVKKVDDKTSFKAGFKTTPIPQAYKAVGKMAKNVDDAIEKRYPNYTGPTSFYAGLKSGAKTLLGYKKGGVTKEHPLTAFRKANEARDAGFKKSLPKAQVGRTIGKPTADSTAYYTNKSNDLFKQSTTLLNKPYSLQPSNDNITTRSKKTNQLSAAAIKAQNDALRQSRKGKPGYDKNGFPIKKK